MTSPTALAQSVAFVLDVTVVSTANMREHWARKARRAQDHRRIAHAVACAEWRKLDDARWPPRWRGWVITLTRIAPRELDDDNLAAAFKSIRDGISDALGIDDRDPRVTWRYAQRRGRARHYAAEIRVEEVL